MVSGAELGERSGSSWSQGTPGRVGTEVRARHGPRIPRTPKRSARRRAGRLVEALWTAFRCPAMNTRAGLARAPEGIRLIREPTRSRQHHPRAIEPTHPASASEARVVPDRHRTMPSPSGGGALFDWIVVGGGPHGVCAARALTAGGASVRIVDPSGALLERWGVRARAVEMVWMRSPAGHHLDAQPVSLHHFLHRPEHADVAELAGTLRRPMHEAFLRHSREVVDGAGLDRSVVRGRVSSIQRRGSELLVLGEGASSADGSSSRRARTPRASPRGRSACGTRGHRSGTSSRETRPSISISWAEGSRRSSERSWSTAPRAARCACGCGIRCARPSSTSTATGPSTASRRSGTRSTSRRASTSSRGTPAGGASRVDSRGAWSAR